MGALQWLNENSGAVTAVATVAGVLVATAYSVFAAFQWRATKQQADLTQRIFEASHRPYLTTAVLEPTETGTHGRLSFAVVFENVGSVPADITRWEISGTLMDLEQHEHVVDRREPLHNPEGESLGPHEQAVIELHFAGGDLPNPPLPFRLRGMIEYRGLTRRIFRTQFDAERAGDAWKTRSQRMR